MVAKSVGFHWGPGAVSTSVWCGVRLADVLRRCGIKLLSSEGGSPARFVCFEGADRLPFDYYGTCIPIERAMDEYFDVLLAYEMNGERLTPDHGFPLRLANNYYHFHDNRVLPPNVDNIITASALDAWHKADDLIYDFNIQSVITRPGHGELVCLDNDTKYTMRGYAYSGSGLKIKRVQVSLDGGKSWCIAQLDHQEGKMSMEQGSRYWCWCLWNLDVQISDLAKCVELTCRAWDASNNTQPQTTEWNLMGMMHNAWYIVKACIEWTPLRAYNPSSNDGTAARRIVSLKFKHPTVVDDASGEGWMKPPVHDLQEVTTLGDKVLEEPDPYRFSRAEVAKHTGSSDAWVIVHNKVYDCSAFLGEHPGGAASILSAAGTDVTKVFKEIHSILSQEIFGNYLLGEVDDYGTGPNSTQRSLNDEGGCRRSFLTPQWQPIRLVKKDNISHDTRIFRFALSDSSSINFGLPTGKHVFLRAEAQDGKVYVRAYTPVSDDRLAGHVEFLIKVYRPTTKFPEGGHLSQVLDSLHIGDTVDVRGPLGSFLYCDHGRWTFGTHSGRACRIVMMAGGTGITPIYQLIRAIVKDPTDRTEVRLIYANRTAEDILLREELCQLEKESAGRVKICDPPKDWRECTGHIDEGMVRKYGTFESHETLNHVADTFAVLCGPPGLIEKACLPNIIKVYGKEMMRMRTFHF
ncbi:hypothetical protein BGZ59_001792 [Podila verticillata]|nr:hypothetical protein BGZ59_001792 [Podila verticillata]